MSKYERKNLFGIVSFVAVMFFFGFGVFNPWVFTAKADEEMPILYVERVETLRIKGTCMEPFTVIQVVLSEDTDSIVNLVDYIELQDSKGETYRFNRDEFHLEGSKRFIIKRLPFLLPDGGIELTVYDNESVEYVQSKPKTIQTSASNGSWNGNTDQDYDVSFTVKDGYITLFNIKQKVYGSGCTTEFEITITGNTPISNDSFIIESSSYNNSYEYSGTFTDGCTSNGTWYYLSKQYCYAEGSGTWNATVDPCLTTSSSSSTTTSTPSCPSELIYGEHAEQTELLRYIRDNVLTQTPEGQEIIRLYYEWSPVIVKAMEQDEEFKEEVKEMIDGALGLMEEEAAAE